ncbi:MAG: ATP-dependent helicase [Deltaproteobacteria bacterium]|nr:ATP-dependent helicase [Deltaproteobacteria bacterium]
MDSDAMVHSRERGPSLLSGHRIDYRSELNDQQFRAVIHRDGPLLVVAGAGSGKTRALVYRVAYLVESGIDPKSILLLTFTRKASREMMRRAATMVDERCMKVSGGTFHSFAAFLLRRHSHRRSHDGSFTIIDRSDAQDIIKLLLGRLGLKEERRRIPQAKTILDIVSRAVNRGTSRGDILNDEYPHFSEAEEIIERVAGAYESFKAEGFLMDYDDLLVECLRLLRDNEDVRIALSERYRYVMVDEYQDTNWLQAEIARLIVAEHHSIMVVGDDSQSIYAFRGARFENILDFPRLFPGCAVITLEQNYRSAQPILSLTNAIIEQAQKKYSKHLFSGIAGDGKPVYLRTSNEREQARFICQRVMELRDSGLPLSQMAVLFRSGWHSNALEVELVNRFIPYAKFGGLRFTEAAHVKDLMAFLRVSCNPSDTIAWFRCLTLHEGIGSRGAQSFIASIVTGKKGYAGLIDERVPSRKNAQALLRLYDLLSGLEGSPAQILRMILSYYRPLLEATYDDYHRRWNDLETLTRIAEGYENLEDLLNDLTLEPPESDPQNLGGEGEQDHLVLSTIHSAKGLEWNTVFLINLVDGCLPSSYACVREEDLEEERRLFYVACTRAARSLYLLSPEIEYSRSYGSGASSLGFSKPSRFVEEMDNFRELTEEWVIDRNGTCR